MNIRIALASVVAGIARHYPVEKGRRRILFLVNSILPDGFYVLPIRLKHSQATIHGFRTDLLSQRLFAFGEDEPFVFRLLSLALQKSSRHTNYIDIGANIGSLSIPLSLQYGCHSICFEPQQSLAEALLENGRLNQVNHLLTVHCVALGSKNGFTDFYVNPAHLGEASIRPLANLEPLSVPIKRLDESIDKNEWLDVAILKVDVEGFEKEVFVGAESLFSIHRPPVVFEINQIALAQRGVSPIDAVLVLRQFGYTQFDALEEVLYPPENGVYLIANILATTAAHGSLRNAYGYNENYVPLEKPYRRVKPLLSMD